MGFRMKKVIKPLCETMNGNPNAICTPPQLSKNIYVLNIIIQGILEKKGREGKGPQKNTQNPNAPNRGIET
jgi:hypothetical protein